MGIIKHKKERTLAVKNKIIFLLLIISSYNFNCQSQTIIGEFKRIDPATAARDIGVKFIFEENSRFEKIEFKHMGTKEKSHGSYSISNDTIILEYEKYESSERRKVKMIQKKQISTTSTMTNNLPLYSSIQVLGKSGNPESGANLVLRNSGKKTIMAFMSDSNGYFPDLNIYDKYVEEFQVSALGQDEIIIRTDSLFGFTSKIKIHFQDSSVLRKSKEATEKFLIQKISDDELSFISLEKNELVLLKRIEK